jgi:3-oxoacyl-[acyl-carrier protein] reductase
MDLQIKGRTAAVAGASAGLGLASARALAAEGARVAICGRDRARIDAAASSIGSDAIALVADVSTENGARGFVTESIEALGQVDILVANAGGPPAGDFASTDYSAYDEALRLNLMSTVAMCQEAIAPMRSRGWGRVVAITSASVREPSPFLILSNTARAGATAFLKTVASEVAADGVTVNTAQPGLHDTDRLAELGVDLDDLAQLVPARAIGDADDFGAAVAFLCSQQARYITGTSLLIDGGRTMGLP